MRCIIKKMIISFFLCQIFVCFGNEYSDFKSSTSVQNAKFEIELKKQNEIKRISYSYPEKCFMADFVEEAYREVDVNFDGFNDVLIYLGSYGNQGVSYYHAYIWNNLIKDYVNTDSFDDIPNLVIDEKSKSILGNSRSSAAHYEYYVYKIDKENIPQLEYKIYELFYVEEVLNLYGITLSDDVDSFEYFKKHFALEKLENNQSIFIKETYNEKEPVLSNPVLELWEDVPPLCQYGCWP